VSKVVNLFKKCVFIFTIVNLIYLDKKAMFLVNTSLAGAQIYDLVTTSSNERKT